jgi:hypothetical protein
MNQMLDYQWLSKAKRKYFCFLFIHRLMSYTLERIDLSSDKMFLNCHLVYDQQIGF